MLIGINYFSVMKSEIENNMNKIDMQDIPDLDLEDLPDGANYIFRDGLPVAVLLNIEYYKYLEHLMFKLRDKIQTLGEVKDGTK